MEENLKNRYIGVHNFAVHLKLTLLLVSHTPIKIKDTLMPTKVHREPSTRAQPKSPALKILI